MTTPFKQENVIKIAGPGQTQAQPQQEGAGRRGVRIERLVGTRRPASSPLFLLAPLSLGRHSHLGEVTIREQPVIVGEGKQDQPTGQCQHNRRPT